MRVNEVMTPGPQCARPDDTIAAIASKMREMNVGSMPVCSDGQKLVGMVTDRDITVRGVAEACDPTKTTASDVMTPQIAWCYDDQSTEDVAQMMRDQQIRRLPVMDRSKRLVGIVSLGDLAVDAHDRKLAGEALEGISRPAHPRR